MSVSGITLSFRYLHQLNVYVVFLDEWAGDTRVNGQLAKTTVIGNVKTEIKKTMDVIPEDRQEGNWKSWKTGEKMTRRLI